MSILDTVFDLNIVLSATAVPTANFGIQLILGYHTKWTDLIRFYSEADDLLTDGFAVTDPEYLAAVAIKSGDNPPDLFAVGRRTHAPTQIYDLTPTAGNVRVYTVTINGVTFSYTSDSSATVAEIVTGLTTAINAGSEPVTATDGTTKLTLTSDVAGAYFTLEVADDSGSANGMALWNIKDVTADAGIAADLAAVNGFNASWYGLTLTFQGAAEILAAAAFVEANKKLFAPVTSDTHARTSATDDILTSRKNAGYVRTRVMYHQKPHQFAGAAWLGVMLAKQPGSANFNFKKLAGVDVSTLSDTDIVNITAKFGCFYVLLGAQGSTFETGAGPFMDTTLGVDWWRNLAQASQIRLQQSNDKISYDDAGVQKIALQLKADLEEGVDQTIFESFTINTQPVASANPNDVAARKNKLISFAAILAGAIDSSTVNGTISSS